MLLRDHFVSRFFVIVFFPKEKHSFFLQSVEILLGEGDVVLTEEYVYPNLVAVVSLTI
jgi:hypothetical protein